MFNARKLTQRELQNVDYLKRDAKGDLCHFVCEHTSGVKSPQLSWTQAVELAERNNAELEYA